ELSSVFPERQLARAQHLLDSVRDPRPIFRHKLDLRGGDFFPFFQFIVFASPYVLRPGPAVRLLLSLLVGLAPFLFSYPCVLRNHGKVSLFQTLYPSMGWTPIRHPDKRAWSPPSDKNKSFPLE